MRAIADSDARSAYDGFMLRTILMVALVGCGALSGCSWILQSHLDSDYQPSMEPDCTSAPGLAIADFVIAGANLGLAAIETLGGNRNDGTTFLIADALAESVVYLASGISGSVWAGECKRAQGKWEERQAAAEAAIPIGRQAAAPRRVERGFFCAVSLSAENRSFCVRDEAACSSAREIAVQSLPDLGQCEVRAAAWCFGTRCAPIQSICDEQRKRVMGADGIAPDCEETR